VLRLAGAIGGAIIVIEPPEDFRRRDRHTEQRRRAGFQDTILLAGFDNHAGELGHVPIDPGFVSDLNRGRPRGLGKLEARHCTCTPSSEPVPHHLEAYASAMALTARLDRKRPMHEVVEDVLQNPGSDANARALTDVGALVAHALVGPVAVLNPARVALTGSMAIEPVRAEIETRLLKEHRFGDMPEVEAIPEPDNKYIRAQGAALAVLRIHVHRELHTLLLEDKDDMTAEIKKLTTRIDDAAIQRLSQVR
jgi:predicted NBD/HSP70 family sugar kinase